MPNHLIDLTGKRFGKLLVISRAENGKYGPRWNCHCDCGMDCEKSGASLRGGNAKNCGCYTPQRMQLIHKTHGGTNTKLYHRWALMKRRCSPNVEERKRVAYHDRGITVCEEWMSDFAKFRDWALQNGYDDKLTIDRIDNNKGYSPDNCRWVDTKTQQRNMRSNRRIMVNGTSVCLSEASEVTGLYRGTISDRLSRGISMDRATNTKHFTTGKPVECIDTGRIFDSRDEAARWVAQSRGTAHGVSIGEAASGKNKKAYGYHWRDAT